ncbi:endonuclease domain-containing protein [Aeoliella sp. SH292]|uniref:endonuclease domain-containing protein n=1 Tax=Aeoliella sp. SH292 TaxID=3454464 RepID=UPI003F952DCF
MPPRQPPIETARARELRTRQTEAEAQLWSVLRGRRLGGLKFRRQLPIPPFIADFACIEHSLIVELDGGYHDYVAASDASRQSYLEQQGWRVIRFTNDEVLENLEGVAVAICRSLGVEYLDTPTEE